MVDAKRIGVFAEYVSRNIPAAQLSRKHQVIGVKNDVMVRAELAAKETKRRWFKKGGVNKNLNNEKSDELLTKSVGYGSQDGYKFYIGIDYYIALWEFCS